MHKYRIYGIYLKMDKYRIYGINTVKFRQQKMDTHKKSLIYGKTLYILQYFTPKLSKFYHKLDAFFTVSDLMTLCVIRFDEHQC